MANYFWPAVKRPRRGREANRLGNEDEFPKASRQRTGPQELIGEFLLEPQAVTTESRVGA
jgi:hypothetical protein